MNNVKPQYTKRAWHYMFWSAFILLILTVCFETWTDIDIYIQNLFYNKETGQWWLTAQEFNATRWLWYGGAKKAISIIAGIAVVLLLASFYFNQCKIWRKACVLLCLSLLFVPVSIGALKKVTNIYCPREVTLYNGVYEYQRILEPAKKENQGKQVGLCFPAGHASGGFALMMLFFALPYPRYRYLGLFIGLSSGWLMGGYQIVRGEHFVSHTIATMCIAWMINLLLVFIIEKYKFQLLLTDSPDIL